MDKFKKFVDAIIAWVKGNGIEGILAIPFLIYFVIAGMWLGVGITIGILFTKNWDMLKAWIKKQWSKSK